MQDHRAHYLQTHNDTPGNTNLNHVFRSGYSRETHILPTLNDFLTEIDKSHQVEIAILDFSKALDTVPHDKMLHKLLSAKRNSPMPDNVLMPHKRMSRYC